MSSQEFIDTEMLHHSQLAFYEQALRPVPQENLYFVEQAGEPVSMGLRAGSSALPLLPTKDFN
ncbi:hypothetical protein QUB16_23945 [Microcoleus sp. D3_18a_C4]